MSEKESVCERVAMQAGALSFIVCVYVTSIYVYGCGCMRVWLGGHSNDKCFCILSAHLDTVARAGGYH